MVANLAIWRPGTFSDHVQTISYFFSTKTEAALQTVINGWEKEIVRTPPFPPRQSLWLPGIPWWMWAEHREGWKRERELESDQERGGGETRLLLLKARQSGVTLIDVWALALIRWLNPSIYMQKRCPMQMGPIRQDKMVLSGSYGNNCRYGGENAACRRGSDAVILQIRRLHACRSPPFGPAPTPKLFCHSFFSLLSGQSLVGVYATLHNAIARTTSTAAAVW